jgi:hypothetical protein
MSQGTGHKMLYIRGGGNKNSYSAIKLLKLKVYKKSKE